jgi:hypothetical protein
VRGESHTIERRGRVTGCESRPVTALSFATVFGAKEFFAAHTHRCPVNLSHETVCRAVGRRAEE